VPAAADSAGTPAAGTAAAGTAAAGIMDVHPLRDMPDHNSADTY